MQILRKSKRLSPLFYLSTLLCSVAHTLTDPTKHGGKIIQPKSEEKSPYDISFCTVPETFKSHHHCGIPATRPKLYSTRIVGGEEARPFSWPYIVSIYYKRKNETECGGTIIGRTFVLTAAHCFDFDENPKHYLVITGAHSCKKKNGVEKIYNPDIIIKHELFNKNYHTENDIAIVKTRQSIFQSCYARRACLPFEKPVDQRFCFTMGWGQTREGGQKSQVLRQVSMPIIRDERCPKIMVKHSIEPGMMCAGVEIGNFDTCGGDSGGPLFCYHQKRFFLKGIVSFGFGCARPGHVGVYSNVSFFMPWILEKVAQHKEELLAARDAEF